MRADRLVGVLVGAAVGDALGAPYEFGPAGALSASGREMQGGGGFGWKPGEWTDDTQMALHIAASLLAHDGVEGADLWARFRCWSRRATDVGAQTRRVLGSGEPWQTAAGEDFERTRHSAGNGSLMRTSPAAVFFARRGPAASSAAARQISALTHGDPVAGECCVVLDELIRVGLLGQAPLEHVDQALDLVHVEQRTFLEPWLDPSWEPNGTDSNGVCWVTLAQALWAVRTHDSFAGAVRAAIDLGDDTDTVACVTGALAGAAFGVQDIPSRWTAVLNGLVPGDPAPAATDQNGLQSLAYRLGGLPERPIASLGTPLPIVEVAPRLFATDLAGAIDAKGHEVVSLCRTSGLIDSARQIWLTDSQDAEQNPRLVTAVLDTVAEIEKLRSQGHEVLLHCHHGRSRTGLIVRAWMERVQGLSYEVALNHALALSARFTPWNDHFESVLIDLAGAPSTRSNEPRMPIERCSGHLSR